jgi:hypothetical protein
MSDFKVSSAYLPTDHQTPSTPVTPHHQIRSPSTGLSSGYITMSDRSHSDIKRKLEQRLADTKTKMYNIGRLGESLVKQEKELNERIKEIESHSQDDEIRPELRSKLADLENGFKEIERESAKAFTKGTPFLGKVCEIMYGADSRKIWDFHVRRAWSRRRKLNSADKVLYLLQRINRARGKLEMPLHANMTSNSQPTSVKVYLRKSGNYKLYSHNGTRNLMKQPRQLHAPTDRLNCLTGKLNKCMKTKVYLH